MSEADKLFEELGYVKVIKSGTIEVAFMKIENYEDILIKFWDDKTVSKTNGRFEEEYINMQELKAINMKCKELGWIE